MPDWKAWGQRTVSRGGAQPSEAPEPPAQQVLPPPPPGYGYAPHAQYGFVLVPLTAGPTALPLVAPPRQPAAVTPYISQPPALAYAPDGVPRQMGRVIPMPIRTCELVKPSARDPYAEFLATVPDLPGVVNYGGGYDAMRGNPSPSTMAELAQLTEAASIGGDLGAYPTPLAPKATGPELGSVALPDAGEKVG